jgi:LysM repeat protein
MFDKKIGVRLLVILILGATLSTACVQSYSAPSAATPSLIPPGLFVSPLPTEGMQLVADFGTQTAIAKAVETNGGTPLTPQPGATSVTDTPGGILITPLSGSSTPAVVLTSTPALVTSVPMTNTVFAGTTVAGGVPATYTMQSGEFVYCIARRYNVDPNELLSVNGLFDSQLIEPGLVLNMPQTGNPFPGARALIPHPATYTVTGYNDTTIYAVACLYGDAIPQNIAQANNLPLSTTLVAGQQLTIP